MYMYLLGEIIQFNPSEQPFTDSCPQMEIEARSEGTCLFNAQDFNHQTRFPCFYSISGYFLK